MGAMYDLHGLSEGQKQSLPDHLTRCVHLPREMVDLGELRVECPEHWPYLSKLSRPYGADTHPFY